MPAAQTTNSSEPPGKPDGRGHFARNPTHIGPKGWWQISKRVARELNRDRVSLVAAGVGFFALLAAFPALAALVSLLGLLATQAEIATWIAAFGDQLPAAVQETLISSLGDIGARPEQQLSITVVAGLLAALWSAKKGVTATMQATNLAYEEQEARSWWKSLLLSLTFTAGALLVFGLALILGVALPLFLLDALASGVLVTALTIGQWLILWLIGALALSVLYRYAPDRRPPKWRWVSVGALVATGLWMLGSVAFGLYAQQATSYQETYGSLAGVIVTMLWLYMTGFTVVLGAEINAEIEHQTAVDTTIGPDRKMGDRDAYVADNVPWKPD